MELMSGVWCGAFRFLPCWPDANSVHPGLEGLVFRTEGTLTLRNAYRAVEQIARRKEMKCRIYAPSPAREYIHRG